MRLTYDISDRGGLVRDNAREGEDRSSVNKRRIFTQFFERSLDAVKSATKVLAIAVGATVVATTLSGCFNTVGRYSEDTDTDAQEEVDADNDVEDGVDSPDIPDVELDETDTIDDEVEDVDTEEELPEPVCFESPAPLDPGVDTLLNNSNSQSRTFNNSGPGTISADVSTNVSVTGYPTALLGVCPDDPDAVAFLAAPDTVVSFEHDVSMVVGNSSWNATLPEISGIKCPGLTPDSDALITNNDSEQQVPKNAYMGGVLTHAGFNLVPVISRLVAYEKNGTVESDGLLTVLGSNLDRANTLKTLVLDGDVDIEVEVRAGDSSENHTYVTAIVGGSSKQARVYPKATDDKQMYDVVWDTSSKYSCFRCVGRDSITITVPGDLLCKVLDDCGCVGDGFDISILGVTVDDSPAPPHMRDLIPTTDDATARSTVGVTAFSDPSTDHPSVTVRIVKGSVSWDDGVLVNYDVNINLELTSQHQNPQGTYDTKTVTVNIRIQDPWAWGSLEPLYSTVCGCTPVCDMC